MRSLRRQMQVGVVALSLALLGACDESVDGGASATASSGSIVSTPTTPSPSAVASAPPDDGLPSRTDVAATVDVFGRVIAVSYGVDYEAVATDSGFTIGPATIHLADGRTIELPTGTEVNTLCRFLRTANAETDEPCFVVARLDGEALLALRVLSYTLLHEGDRIPTLFTSTKHVEAVTDSAVVLEDGVALEVDKSFVELSCGSVTTVDDLVGASVASIRLVVDPTSGIVTRIECAQEF